jgi:hypothetical protein
VGLGANSSLENGNRHDHRDWVRTGVGTHRTTAMQTCVRARTDGHRVYAASDGVHATTGVGV